MSAINRHERIALREKVRNSIERCGSVILCTVIQKAGPFYRPVGFQCAIDQHGAVTPFFAGSCTDRLVAGLARERLANGEFPTLISVDSSSREDAVMGSGSGCGGNVEILCEQLQAEDLSRLDLLVGPRNQQVNELYELRIERTSEGWHVQRVLNPADCYGPSSSVVQHLQIVRTADPRLWIIGGADDAFAVADLAQNLGWWVGLVDHRGPRDQNALPIAVDQFIGARPDAINEQLFRYGDHVVIMSHNLQVDGQWLEILSTAPISSVGLLGPIDRCQALINQLTPEQRETLMPCLRQRTGVAFKSRSPEHLAVAIMAELQTIWENS